METKDMVVSRGWTYSSTLYLAILDECIARQDYAMASMIVQVCVFVFVVVLDTLAAFDGG